MPGESDYKKEIVIRFYAEDKILMEDLEDLYVAANRVLPMSFNTFLKTMLRDAAREAFGDEDT